MKKICFQDSCPKRVIFVCNCTQALIYSCDDHFGKHLRLKGSHASQESLVIQLDPPDSQDLYSKLIKVKKNLENLLKRTIIETKSLIEKITNESQQLIDQIVTKELKILELIKYLNLENNANKEDLNEITKMLDINLTEKSKESLFREITSFYDFNNRVDFSEPKPTSEFLCFFKGLSKNLVLVDIDKSDIVTRIEVSIDMPACFHIASAHCELPNKKYFFYGGIGSKSADYTNKACIIDIKSQKGIQIRKGTAKMFMTCCYSKQKIYIFGGENEKGALKDAEKYDLANDSWENLSPLPMYCENGTCFISKDEITYAGYYSTSVVVYSISNNSYTKFGSFGPKTNKILCHQGNITYLFESGNLHRTKNCDWNSSEVINDRTGVYQDDLVINGIFKGKKFYFFSGNLYKFDLDTETVVLLDWVWNT
jgi:Galactose oxidase, central domain